MRCPTCASEDFAEDAGDVWCSARCEKAYRLAEDLLNPIASVHNSLSAFATYADRLAYAILTGDERLKMPR